MTTSTSNLITRNFRWDDLPALIDLINLSRQRHNIDDPADLQSFRSRWEAINIQPETDCLLVVDSNGQLIAAVSAWQRKDNIGRGMVEVHPDYLDSQIVSNAIDATDSHFRENLAATLNSSEPIAMQRGLYVQETGKRTLLESLGYREVRRFHEMRIDFTETYQPITLPDGLELRPIDFERDAPAIHAATQEAFLDHWGNTERPFDSWVRRHKTEYFDPTLWFVAYDRATGDIAGAALCGLTSNPGRGYVNNLSVRRPYRKRGLGMALLKHAFYVFQQRGKTQVGLGVDADNLTNAVALYQRAGMRVHLTDIAMRRMLRGQFEDIQD